MKFSVGDQVRRIAGDPAIFEKYNFVQGKDAVPEGELGTIASLNARIITDADHPFGRFQVNWSRRAPTRTIEIMLEKVEPPPPKQETLTSFDHIKNTIGWSPSRQKSTA